MRFNYVTASVDEVAQHFKNKTRQLVHLTKERYSDNPDVLAKLERAYIMSKIARLQDELESLVDSNCASCGKQ
jgi:hypothetical protein